MRTLQLAITAIIFSAASAAFAFKIDAKVIQSNESNTKVIVALEKPEVVEPGQYLSSGTMCELEVLKSFENRMILDASLCEEKSLIKNGQTLTLSNMPIVAQDQPFEEAGLEPEPVEVNQVPSEIMVRPSTRTIIQSRKKMDNTPRVIRGTMLTIGNSDFKGREESSSAIITGEMDSKFTVGIEYANIGVRKFGGIGGIKYTQFRAADKTSSDPNAVRLMGSVAYGFGKNIYGFAGINVNRFGNSSMSEYTSIELGNQVGVGVQINEQFGLNLSHVTIRNNGKINFQTVEFKADGPEFAVTTTF